MNVIAKMLATPHAELLGLTVTDRITGFMGVVTGHVDYITG